MWFWVCLGSFILTGISFILFLTVAMCFLCVCLLVWVNQRPYWFGWLVESVSTCLWIYMPKNFLHCKSIQIHPCGISVSMIMMPFSCDSHDKCMFPLAMSKDGIVFSRLETPDIVLEYICVCQRPSLSCFGEYSLLLLVPCHAFVLGCCIFTLLFFNVLFGSCCLV